MSTLLLNSHPLVILPELACAIGLNEAIVVQQIHYWTEHNRRSHTNFRDGYYWTYNTYAGWEKQFPWRSAHTVRRILKGLEASGIVVTGKYNNAGFDQTKWYRLNYSKIAEKAPSAQIGQMDMTIMDRPIPETNTENKNNGIMVSTDTSVPTVAIDEEDADISQFIKWYFDYYQSLTGEPPPQLRHHKKSVCIMSLKISAENILLNLMDCKLWQKHSFVLRLLIIISITLRHREYWKTDFMRNFIKWSQGEQ